MMRNAETALRISTHGNVPPDAAGLAAAKLGPLMRTAAEPVLSARVMLAVAGDPAVGRPWAAQATVDMNGRVVRAQASAETMRAAIERMASRLEVRLRRAARNWAALRGTVSVPEPGEWRHQSIPARGACYATASGGLPEEAGQETVISRVSYAAENETPAEAAVELDLLDYDFHLFTERSSGQDCVIYRVTDGLRIAMAHPKRGRLGPLPASMTVSAMSAPRLSAAEATRRLDVSGQLFTFYVDAGNGRGSVIYRRYDGDYGRLLLPPRRPSRSAAADPGAATDPGTAQD